MARNFFYQNHKSSNSKGSTSNDVCNYCKENGHWKTKCPKLKTYQEKKKNSDKKKASASVAQVEVDSKEVDEIHFEGDPALVMNNHS